MKLNEQYFIKSDENCLTLVKVSETKKAEAKNKFREEIVGYFGNINHLYESLLEREIRDNIGDFEKFYNRTEELKALINER